MHFHTSFSPIRENAVKRDRATSDLNTIFHPRKGIQIHFAGSKSILDSVENG